MKPAALVIVMHISAMQPEAGTMTSCSDTVFLYKSRVLEMRWRMVLMKVV